MDDEVAGCLIDDAPLCSTFWYASYLFFGMGNALKIRYLLIKTSQERQMATNARYNVHVLENRFVLRFWLL